MIIKWHQSDRGSTENVPQLPKMVLFWSQKDVRKRPYIAQVGPQIAQNGQQTSQITNNRSYVIRAFIKLRKPLKTSLRMLPYTPIYL